MRRRPSFSGIALALIGIWLLMLVGCAMIQERGRREQRDRWMHEDRAEPL